jgi:hypothetical protein
MFALLVPLQVTTDQITGVYWDLQTSNEGRSARQSGTRLFRCARRNNGRAKIGAAGVRDRSEMLADMAIAEWAAA